MKTLVSDPKASPVQDRVDGKAANSAWSLKVEAEGVASLTFDMPGSSANVFNLATLRELDERLAEIESRASIHRLIIRSAKERVFVAGADLKTMRSADPAGVEQMIGLGQSVLRRLAKLPMLKIAMIRGACVGGGFELALACDVRVAIDDETTRIGLPETQLGLVPAWGGCTRLPRLIGLPNALDVILSGRLMKAREALKLGLVDQVVRSEESFVESRLSPGRSRFVNAWGVRHVIAAMARRSVMAKTHGLYEAPLIALRVATKGLGLSMEDSLACEREAITHLVGTDATRNLIDLFFRKEEASKKPWPQGHTFPVNHVAVIGAGVMGAGIAQWLAAKGVRVTLCDISVEAVAKGMKRVRDLVEEGVKRRVLSKKEARDTLDRISPDHTAVPLHSCQLVIEAATEDMELKKRIFAGLAARCGSDTILATNTSALSVAELAKSVRHPERVIGLHFFNPVHRMSLIEIIKLPHTLPDVIATAHGFAQSIGKVPVVVNDSPGFVVNRVLMPYLMEAVRLFEQGHNLEAIDGAMLRFGMPMGPMRLLDEIGLDVAAHVASTLKADTFFLHRMIERGWRGKKSGVGFYLHKGGGAVPNKELYDLRSASPEATYDLQMHLAQKLGDEAKRCLNDGVARSAADIDLSLVLGTGYAPFRGGPLHYSMETISNDSGSRAV